METNNLEKVINNIVRDIRVELLDEFDRNFDRQGFFSDHWARRKSPIRPGRAILIDTGGLRRSIKAVAKGMSVVFSSAHPAASIHNDGGVIVVTARMKRYFWARHIEASGTLLRRKNGELSRSKRNMQANTEAQFWKAMALMKAGSKITIPRRRFIGEAPEVTALCEHIISQAIEQYFSTMDPRKP